MAETSRTEVFDVGVEAFFNTVTDYESYPDFMDGVSSVEVLESSEQGARIKYNLNLIKKFTYILNMVHEHPFKVSWSFEEGDLFATNEGSWEFKDLGDGQTEVTYNLNIDFKVKVPKMILGKLAGKNLPKMMESVCERARG